MPKKGKQGNGYDRELLERFLTEIDDADDRLASAKSKYMLACKPLRQDIATVFEEAKDAGIPVRAFKTLVKNRRLDRKIANNTARLEADDAESYDKLVTDLGDFVDLPLGAAALARARPGHQESALDSLDA